MTKISDLPEKDAPLTKKEMEEACDIFFPLYEEIAKRLPEAKTEDRLAVMKNVAELAQRERSKKRKEETNKIKFGFNKNPDTGLIDVTKEEVVDEE